MTDDEIAMAAKTAFRLAYASADGDGDLAHVAAGAATAAVWAVCAAINREDVVGLMERIREREE